MNKQTLSAVCGLGALTLIAGFGLSARPASALPTALSVTRLASPVLDHDGNSGWGGWQDRQDQNRRDLDNQRRDRENRERDHENRRRDEENRRRDAENRRIALENQRRSWEQNRDRHDRDNHDRDRHDRDDQNRHRDDNRDNR